MSSQFEISSVNRQLFNKSILEKSISEDHRILASKIKEHFDANKNKNPTLLSSEKLLNLSEDDTIDYYVDPILKILGYKFRKKLQDTNSKYPDIWLFLEEPDSKNSEYLQRNNLTVLEAKKYKVNLDQGETTGKTPPQQIVSYIHTNQRFNKRKRWGILTNGYKWRLYSADSTEKYIEFDIDHALENAEHLAMFCLVFAPSSFKIRGSRTDLLTDLEKESLESWVKVTTEIEERGNKILLNLVGGYFESGLSLKKSKEVAYDTLFRLLYILYIESKHLIPKSSVKYGQVSLRNILHAMYETSVEEFQLSKSINSLFLIYEKGSGVLPPKYGGEHFKKIPNKLIKNKWLKTALDLLTVFDTDSDKIRFFDYSSLNVELIGNIYEATLGLIFKSEGKTIQIKKIKSKTGTEVHSTGTTYTPPNVVKYLVESAFPNKLKGIPTVCDPACGSGHFLVQALRHLSAAIPYSTTKAPSHEKHKRLIAINALFGNDINPLAVSLARLMLAIETAEEGVPAQEFSKNICQFNSLLTKWKTSPEWLGKFKNPKLAKEKGFDFVIGNPPYVRADEPDQLENRKSIVNSKQYEWLHMKWDLFIPFVELAFGLTKATKGVIAFVVSDGITYAPYADKCTSALVKSKKVQFVSHFNKPFDRWAFPATCFVVNQAKECKLPERRIHEGNLPERIVSRSGVVNPFLNAEKAGAAALSDSWKGLRFGDCLYISVGMVLNSNEKKEGPKFEKKDLIRIGGPDKTHPIRYLDNEDIHAGFLKEAEKKFIEFGHGLRAPDKIRRPTFPELHTGQRVLLGRSKLGGAAVCIRKDTIVSDNTIVLKRWADLLGVSNRQIKMKAKLSAIPKAIKLSKVITQRDYLEELSEIISYDLVLGIFLSDFYIKWVKNDKRHKHVVVPDVISELPLPVKQRSKVKQFPQPKFDLSFESRLKQLSKMPPEKAFDETVFLIEHLTSQLVASPKGTKIEKFRSYLNALVELLYRPVISKSANQDWTIERILVGLSEIEKDGKVRVISIPSKSSEDSEVKEKTA